MRKRASAFSSGREKSIKLRQRAKYSMPRKDIYHNAVRRALEKDDWQITHDPFVIKLLDLTIIADLGAKKIRFDKEIGRKMVVEIKVFGGRSKTTDFEKAKGQYDIYQIAMTKNRINSTLFLAITAKVYRDYFLRPSIQEIIATAKINLLIFDSEREEIVKWINWKDTDRL